MNCIEKMKIYWLNRNNLIYFYRNIPINNLTAKQLLPIII